MKYIVTFHEYRFDIDHLFRFDSRETQVLAIARATAFRCLEWILALVIENKIDMLVHEKQIATVL